MKRTSSHSPARSATTMVGAGPILARAGAIVGLVTGLVASTLACERAADAGPQAKAEARSTVSQAPTQGEAARAAGEPAGGEPQAQSSYREDGFVLSLQAPGPVEVGKPAHAEVILESNAPYKVNQEYPIKLSLSESPGLAVAASTIGKDAVTLEAKKAVMKVAFTPKAAGEHKLAGRLSFSVCTEERCLIEKRDLAVKVVVR